jgi:uncharacterized protein
VRSSLETSFGEVSALLEGPDSPEALIVLAHGAGGGFDGPFMNHMAEGLVTQGIGVCRFNFPYAERGRRTPDRQPVLEQAYREVVASLRARAHERLILGGKSMGGRIASHIVAAGVEADGLVFLGYPLHPPGKPERLRADHLRSVSVPMLFVEGTRDPFCPLATLDRVRAGLAAPTEVAVIDGGDHSFKLRGSAGRSTAEAWSQVVTEVSDWVRRRIRGPARRPRPAPTT